MPPIRTMPTVRPVRTERTHEENQERAYIAASRRSDRSLEARVESARRASEIHKKRTGRSLRVREEDVMNEEMYEEEDDDLPMQYRRISALNPGLLPYTAFNDRVNSYLAGQIGVRNYLHQAIFQANQNQYANQFLNPLLQHNNLQHGGTMSPQALASQPNGQSSWSMPGMPGNRPTPHGRSASIANTQELTNYASLTQTAAIQPAGLGFSARRMSMSSASSPGILSPGAASSHPTTPHPLSQHNNSSGSQQEPTPQAQGGNVSTESTPVSRPMKIEQDVEAQAYPLTTKLPMQAQQLLDGSTGFASSIFASQMASGIPMPSTGNYSYNPNGKKRNSNDSAPTGLHQTLSPFNMHNAQEISSIQEPQSAMSAPGNLDFGFNNNDLYGNLGAFHDPNYNFELNFSGGDNTGGAHSSGQATPNEGNWNDTDFFNYAAASD